ncbi:MAG: DUF2752 domain-containing protein [Ignavibacteriae bacterium]|nr:DUF2752 domain-containing protein [Ignavibacteriota bacterium]NOG99565.1 DUF2752 domain-containing protein [Ignavibacteriota bacterium]
MFFSIKKIPLEAYLWIAGLIYLFLINPYQDSHFTICPFNNLGIDFCPGCGIGKSISFIYYADFINSFKSHPLGVFALLVILYRIINLIYKSFSKKTFMEVYNG